MNDIRLLITDFDGTLVETFEANFLAYQKAFIDNQLSLTVEQYRMCFGLRFDDFMNTVGITDPEIKYSIREKKANYYPLFFEHIKINKPLLTFINAFKEGGGKTAIASTARQKNLMNVLSFLHLENRFDLILAGEDVKQGKPSPEIYLTVMEQLSVAPINTLIFEDTAIGIEAATASGAICIQITSNFFE